MCTNHEKTNLFLCTNLTLLIKINSNIEIFLLTYFDSQIKTHLVQIKTNSRFCEIVFGFLDSGLVVGCLDLDSSEIFFLILKMYVLIGPNT